MLARDVMTTEVATIAPNAPLHVVAETMVERGVTGLPVVDGSLRLLGLLTEGDLLYRLAAPGEAQHGYLSLEHLPFDQPAGRRVRPLARPPRR